MLALLPISGIQMLSKQELHANLSFCVLTHKFHYYVNRHAIISDETFDKVVMKYRELCKELNLTPTADDMVEFDMDKPSCRLVAQVLKENPGKWKEIYGEVAILKLLKGG